MDKYLSGDRPVCANGFEIPFVTPLALSEPFSSEEVTRQNCLHPGGTSDNSPTLERWDLTHAPISPEGTAEKGVSAVPSGRVRITCLTQR
jgi:hypothetical protein